MVAAGLLALACASKPAPASPSPTQSAASAQPTSSAAEGAEREQPVPADLQPVLKRASQIGVELYLLDKAAAIGSDVLSSRVQNPGAKQIRGYLPLREGDETGKPTGAFRVTFFTSDTPPRVAYEIRVVPGVQPDLEEIEPPRAAPPELAEWIRARQTALDSVPERSQPLNPVVLPGEAIGDTGLLVYLLAGTERPNVAVIGRHFRVLIQPGGQSVKQFTPLTNSVLELPLEVEGGTRNALVVKDPVTDYPLETHVFTSLLVKLPIYVGTRRGLWRVKGDKIAFLGAIDPPGEGTAGSAL